MKQESIGQRIKFLIGTQKLSVRKFAQLLDLSEATVRNYFDRGTKPSSDFFEKLHTNFPLLNLTWLIAGEGEPFPAQDGSQQSTASTRNNYGNSVGVNHGMNVMGNVGASAATARELAALRTELTQARTEIQSLKGELARADALVAAKQETIDFMRGAMRNPN